MKNKMDVRMAMRGLLSTPGAFVLVDGQFGSTGKGLAADYLARCTVDMFKTVTSNAGPNSGHTSYFGLEKIVLQQLPTFGVIAKKMGFDLHMHMNAGAIIDLDKIEDEIDTHGVRSLVSIHPRAAIVTDEALDAEGELVGAIGSTGKGTGAALARKVMRMPEAIVSNYFRDGITYKEHQHAPYDNIFVEVSQGYSLSLNASPFYPHTTSRDCTVMQALSDAGIHPSFYRGSMMVVRTFPIRVAGNSGACYPDQEEITWEHLGQTPEITTVTKKVRRVFTWSDIQFHAALRANRPNMLFFNFLNYLGGDRDEWVRSKLPIYEKVMGRKPLAVLSGFGPTVDDVVVFDV